MKPEHKQALRCFLLKKLREVTYLQLSELAETHDCQPFDMTVQFEIEVGRIEKFFAVEAARTTLAQPEPVAPTDEELWDLYQDLGSYFSPTEFARTVLARWGRPTIEPVPGVEGEP